jgi:hypothetical protein
VAYNGQDVEALVVLISDDVDWIDDDTGRLHGEDEARAHWTEQWARTRTHDEPVGLSKRADGRTAVHISQVVRSGSQGTDLMVRGELAQAIRWAGRNEDADVLIASLSPVTFERGDLALDDRDGRRRHRTKPR